MKDLKKYSVIQLLQQQALIIDELIRRDVVRTRNNPVADYGEYIVAKSLGLTLENNSHAGFDATDTQGARFQIKARRITLERKSAQLGVIRNLDKKDFDYLIAVIFNHDFSVNSCYKIPREVIAEYSRYSKHQNGHILILKGAILDDSLVESINLPF